MFFNDLPRDGFDECILCGMPTDGMAFCKDCWQEYEDYELLDMVNDYVQELCNAKEKIDKKQEEINCIVCGEPSNGKHFCKKCYKEFANKVLYLKIKRCKEFEKLEAEYESDFVCDDGHMAKSPYEQIIDNWLYAENIKHAYEKKIDIDEKRDITPDFYIPEYNGIKNIYVEFFGYGEANTKYQKIKEYKEKIYPELVKKQNIAVVYLTKKDIEKNTYKKIIKYAEPGKIKKSEK